MEIQITKPTKTEGIMTPNMLARKAKREFLQTGSTDVRCEKCGGMPTIRMTLRGERTIVSCPCGYVHDVEFNL